MIVDAINAKSYDGEMLRLKAKMIGVVAHDKTSHAKSFGAGTPMHQVTYTTL